MKLLISFTLVLFVALSCAQSNSTDEKKEETFVCVPKEVFKKDCQDCTCSATGTYAVCNMIACDPENKSSRLKAPENCKDDDVWSDGCNACRCIKGNFACTRKICPMLLGEKPADVEGSESEQTDVKEPIV